MMYWEYHLKGNFKYPYRTHALLWEAIDTITYCEEIANSDEVTNTSEARAMLKNIGIKICE